MCAPIVLSVTAANSAMIERQQILNYFEQLIERDGMSSLRPFQRFLQALFDKPEVQQCYADVSLTSVVLCRYPRRESRHKPVLCCRPATSRHIVLEFQVTESTTPLRTISRTSNCRYNQAMEEFERLWPLFAATFAHNTPND